MRAAALIISLCFTACASAADSSSASPPSVAARVPFESPPHGFAVAFPAEPTVAAGTMDAMYVTQFVTTGEEFRYKVLVLDLPTELSKHSTSFFDGMRRGMTRNGRAQLVSEQPIALDEREGRRFQLAGEVDGQPGFVDAMVYLGEGRAHLVSIEGLATSRDPAHVEAFLSSFVLLPEPPPSLAKGNLRAADGRFRIDFPSVFEEKEHGLAGRAFIAKVGDHTFEVQFDTLAMFKGLDIRSHAAAGFDGMRDRVVANAGGVLLAERDMMLEGHPGRHLLIRAGDDLIEMIAYTVDDRFYTITVVGPEATRDAALSGKFFSSFALE